MLVKAREIEEARRLEEEARRKAEEEARRKVPWVFDIAYLSQNAVWQGRDGLGGGGGAGLGGTVSRIILACLLPVSPLGNNTRCG